ncbi:MAG: hypothetical protein PHF63_09440 [Herbinix sp.]|nr:hypothetical protein [Herbinix sp.]
MKNNGKVIFKKFVVEIKNKLILNLTIWICLLVIAVLIGFSDFRVMAILVLFGILIGYINIKNWLQYKMAMKNIKSLEKFYAQLDKVDLEQFKDWKLIITDEYVITAHENIQIFPFTKIDNVEIGIQEGGLKPNKNIFVTLKGDSERHKIAQAYSTDEIPSGFYKAFETILKKIQDNK